MSTGRKYIEKMMEGVTEFDMSGGTILYKTAGHAMSADTTLTAAQSGTHFLITTNLVTASLPAATVGAGVTYTFTNVVAAATADLLITSSTAGSSFLGNIGGGEPTNENAYAAIAGTDFAIQAGASALSDTFSIISTGDKWLVFASNVSGSSWEFKTRGNS